MSYEGYFNRALLLMRRAHGAGRAFIAAKFELGKIVFDIQQNARYGDRGVVKLAEDLTRELRYTVHPQRLWECARVYRAFNGDINRIWQLEKELRFPLTWSFLVKNSPPPDVENETEFIHYWREKLQRWEETLLEMEETKAKLDSGKILLPEAVKTETCGVLKQAGLDVSGKLKKLFKVIERLLSELHSNSIELDEEVIKLFQRIDHKLHQILEVCYGSSEKMLEEEDSRK